MLVVQIRMPASAKAAHFNANGIDFDAGEKVIVDTERGPELGEVIRATYESPDFDHPMFNKLRRVIRHANSDDETAFTTRMELETEGHRYCRERIKTAGLPMVLVKCEASTDLRKVVFYFTAEGRVDFRDLVKDLAQKLRIRIEMRQIGARDAARVKGGFGHCGRPLCCATWLKEFAPVSIKMAKAQGLSMNPTKISGMCGRLMCCLRYEVVDAAGNAKKGGCSGGGCGSSSEGDACGTDGAKPDQAKAQAGALTEAEAQAGAPADPDALASGAAGTEDGAHAPDGPTEPTEELQHDETSHDEDPSLLGEPGEQEPRH